jgi:hypothetical protein
MVVLKSRAQRMARDWAHDPVADRVREDPWYTRFLFPRFRAIYASNGWDFAPVEALVGDASLPPSCPSLPRARAPPAIDRREEAGEELKDERAGGEDGRTLTPVTEPKSAERAEDAPAASVAAGGAGQQDFPVGGRPITITAGATPTSAPVLQAKAPRPDPISLTLAEAEPLAAPAPTPAPLVASPRGAPAKEKSGSGSARMAALGASALLVAVTRVDLPPGPGLLTARYCRWQLLVLLVWWLVVEAMGGPTGAPQARWALPLQAGLMVGGAVGVMAVAALLEGDDA